MINSTTPYKLSEIIRDTWPNLYNKITPIRNNGEVLSGISTNYLENKMFDFSE